MQVPRPAAVAAPRRVGRSWCPSLLSTPVGPACEHICLCRGLSAYHRMERHSGAQNARVLRDTNWLLHQGRCKIENTCTVLLTIPVQSVKMSVQSTAPMVHLFRHRVGGSARCGRSERSTPGAPGLTLTAVYGREMPNLELMIFHKYIPLQQSTLHVHTWLIHRAVLHEFQEDCPVSN